MRRPLKPVENVEAIAAQPQRLPPVGGLDEVGERERRQAESEKQQQHARDPVFPQGVPGD